MSNRLACRGLFLFRARAVIDWASFWEAIVAHRAGHGGTATIFEQRSELCQRRDAHARPWDDLHRCAYGYVEHPRGDLDTVAPVTFRDLALQEATPVPIDLAMDNHFSPVQRMPRVVDSAKLAFGGSVTGPCITSSGTTRDSITGSLPSQRRLVCRAEW